jgi:hypothetical protein
VTLGSSPDQFRPFYGLERYQECHFALRPGRLERNQRARAADCRMRPGPTAVKRDLNKFGGGRYPFTKNIIRIQGYLPLADGVIHYPESWTAKEAFMKVVAVESVLVWRRQRERSLKVVYHLGSEIAS